MMTSNSTLIDTCVLPVANCAAEVWCHTTCRAVIKCCSEKAINVFLGVHKFAAHLAVMVAL